MGHRCPSCGHVTPGGAEQPAEQSDTAFRRDEPTSWSGLPLSNSVPIRQAVGGTLSRSPSVKKRRGGLIASLIVAVVVVAIIVGVIVALTAGGGAVVKEEAAVTNTPDKANDLAAQSLLRNAMTFMDAAFVETTDYTAITESSLQTTEPAINWIQGSAGVSTSPPSAASVQQSAVSWAGTGRMSYELGIWSASGVEFGVSVNRTSGGLTYYRNGTPGAW